MDVLIFDHDNTLYPAEKHLFGLIDVRINRYMTEIVGIPAPEVDALRREYEAAPEAATTMLFDLLRSGAWTEPAGWGLIES